MSRYIDAERAERDGWYLQRNVTYLTAESGYGYVETIRPTNYPAADIPRWIPVTERLPEERGSYLVTVNDGGIRVAIAQWWYDVDNGGEWYFVYDDYYVEDIVAWMPLPKPYKEGEQE